MLTFPLDGCESWHLGTWIRMPDIQARTNDEEKLKATEAFTARDLTCAFGPSFFLGPLGRFVRDRSRTRKRIYQWC